VVGALATRSNDDSLPCGVYQETVLSAPERRAAAGGVALGITVNFGDIALLSPRETLRFAIAIEERNTQLYQRLGEMFSKFVN
jgi:hypothetical protein